jgi:hypothetical protein
VLIFNYVPVSSSDCIPTPIELRDVMSKLKEGGESMDEKVFNKRSSVLVEFDWPLQGSYSADCDGGDGRWSKVVAERILIPEESGCRSSLRPAQDGQLKHHKP